MEYNKAMKAVVSILLLLVFFVGCGPKGPPRYQGKSLRYWAALAASKEPAKRQEAADAMGKIGPTSLRFLVKLLSDEDRHVRNRAVLSMIGMGEKAAPELILLLQNPDPQTRTAAAKAIKVVGLDAKSAIPALKVAVEDADPAVRREAHQALQRLTTKSPLSAETPLKR